MVQLRLADTPLALWMAEQMAQWRDPETNMPGLSQNRLAELSGVSQTQLHEILKKGHEPKPDTLNRLARVLDVDPMRLYRLAYLTEEISDVNFWDFALALQEALGPEGRSNEWYQAVWEDAAGIDRDYERDIYNEK